MRGNACQPFKRVTDADPARYILVQVLIFSKGKVCMQPLFSWVSHQNTPPARSAMWSRVVRLRRRSRRLRLTHVKSLLISSVSPVVRHRMCLEDHQAVPTPVLKRHYNIKSEYNIIDISGRTVKSIYDPPVDSRRSKFKVQSSKFTN